MKKQWLIGGVLGLCFTAFLLSGRIAKRYHTEPETTLNATNTNPAIFAQEADQLAELRPYQEVTQQLVKGSLPSMTVLPGLLATKTLASGAVAMCTEMTPQGVVATEDYVIVSSYCHHHQHNSVLYVLEKTTGTYLKTIILPGKPHVGGLAYDPQQQRLWITGRRKQKAELLALDLQTIEAYQGDQPVKVTLRRQLHDIPRASMLTYYEGSLFVGYFSLKSEGIILQYELKNGDLQGDSARKLTLDSADSPIGQVQIERRIQGLAFYQDKLLLSQSYGPYNRSKLLVYDNIYEKDNFSARNAAHVLRLPAHLEQISVEGDDLLLIFESAATPYKGFEFTTVDRILRMDLAGWLKAQKND